MQAAQPRPDDPSEAELLPDGLTLPLQVGQHHHDHDQFHHDHDHDHHHHLDNHLHPKLNPLSGKTEFQTTVSVEPRRKVQFERKPSTRYARSDIIIIIIIVIIIIIIIIIIVIIIKRKPSTQLSMSYIPTKLFCHRTEI